MYAQAEKSIPLWSTAAAVALTAYTVLKGRRDGATGRELAIELVIVFALAAVTFVLARRVRPDGPRGGHPCRSRPRLGRALLAGALQRGARRRGGARRARDAARRPQPHGNGRAGCRRSHGGAVRGGRDRLVTPRMGREGVPQAGLRCAASSIHSTRDGGPLIPLS